MDTWAPVLGCGGHHNKAPQTGQLKQQTVFRRWKSTIKVWAGLCLLTLCSLGPYMGVGVCAAYPSLLARTRVHPSNFIQPRSPSS